MRSTLQALDIRPGEGRMAGLLFLHSFCIGVPRVLTSTAAMALFLAEFEATSLPFVYLGAAAAIPLTGWVRLHVAERLPFRRLLFCDLAVVLLALLSLRAALGLGAGWTATLLLPVWFEVEWVLLNLEFWGLAGQLLDVRQGKRLFGPIGAGELLAGALAGLAVPGIVESFGTPALLVVSALAVAASIAVLGVTLRLFPQEAATVPARMEDAGRGAGFGELLRSRYAGLLFQLVAVSYVGYYVLDNMFYTAAAERLEDPAELAAFLGVFWCVVSSITLAFRALVASRVLTRYGLLGGLLVLPLAVGLGATAVGAGSALSQPVALVFWVVAASRLFDQVLRESVDLSAVLVLYQPLPPAQRVGAQTAVEGIVGPLAGGLAGLVLLVAIRGLGFGIPQLSALLIGVIAAWLAVVLRVRRAYTRMLSTALARRRLVGGGLSLGDASSVEVLQRGLESQHAGEVAYCLDVLEELQHTSLAGFVTGLLGHPEPEVRRDALLRVERLGLSQALWAVRESVARERTPQVQAAALRALAAVGDESDVEIVLARVDDPEPETRSGARVALLRNGGIEGVLEAGQRLMEQARAAAPGERTEAARLIGEVGVPSFYRPLLALARDPDPGVRRAALHSAGRLDNPRLWPLALEALPDPRFRSAAVGALRRWGDAVVPLLEAAFDRAVAEDDRVTPRRVVRLWGQIRSPRAIAALWERIGADDPIQRQAVLSTLVLCGYRPAGAERRRVRTRLEREMEETARTVASILDLGGGPDGALVRSLEDALDAGRDRILSLLALRHPPELIQRARVNLRSRTAGKRAQAIELIDAVTQQDVSEWVVPLLEDLPHAARLERMSSASRPERLPRLERLRVLASGEQDHGAWCRACAIETVAEERIGDLASEVRRALISRDPLVAETAAWAASRMGMDGAALPAEVGERIRGFDAAAQEGGRMLSTVEKVIILKSVDIFSETPDDVLAEVAPLLEEVDFEAGRPVFEKGDMGSALYVVIEGRVRVHDGEHTLRELGPRDIFGEMAALDPEPRSASVTAVEPTRLFRLEQEGLYNLMADRIEVVRGVIRVLCQRLRVRVD